MAPARILGLAGAYAALVFAFGFAFGAFRVLVLAPAIGAVAAVLVEVPLMLAVSALVLDRLFGKTPCAARRRDLAILGGLAFLILQMLEAAIGGFFGPERYLANVVAYLGGFGDPARAIGLAAQILFGLLPLTFARRFHHVQTPSA